VSKYSTNKDLNDLAREAVKEGWTITFSGGGHLQWLTPCGKRKFFSSQTPSCQYAATKVRHDMKKALAAALALASPEKPIQLTKQETVNAMSKLPVPNPSPALTQRMTIPPPETSKGATILPSGEEESPGTGVARQNAGRCLHYHPVRVSGVRSDPSREGIRPCEAACPGGAAVQQESEARKTGTGAATEGRPRKASTGPENRKQETA
jgi:hypothetical protein